ncbi:MAG: metallophosphoesterase [Terrimesophilobacter sp.]
MSDTRLLAGTVPTVKDAGPLLFNRVSPEARLRRAVDRFESSGIAPQAIVFTGDISELGEAGSYSLLRTIIDPIAERLGATVIWVPGERDSRAAFRVELLGQLPSDDSIDRVTFLDGLRVITLDTSVPGSFYGHVEPEQLDWLAEELSAPAPYGTILAMHHPPIPSVIELDASVELRNQSALACVLSGSDVRTILAGHLHYSCTATFAGIPVSVASATCFTQDLTAPAGAQRLVDGAQSYNLVTVFDDTVMHTVVPVTESPVLSHVSAEEARRLLELEEVRFDESAIAVSRNAERTERPAPVWRVTGR